MKEAKKKAVPPRLRPPTREKREKGRKLAPLLVPGPVVDLAVPYGTHTLLSICVIINQSVSQPSSCRLVSQSQTSSRPIHCLPGVHSADCPQSTCDKLDHILSIRLHTANYTLQSIDHTLQRHCITADTCQDSVPRPERTHARKYNNLPLGYSTHSPLHHQSTRSSCLKTLWLHLVSGVCAVVVRRIIRLPLFPFWFLPPSCLAPCSWLLASAEPHLPCTEYISTRPSIVDRHQHQHQHQR